VNTLTVKKKNRYQSTENPHVLHDVPLCNLEGKVRHTISAQRRKKPFIFDKTIKSKYHIRLILTSYPDYLSWDEITYGHFMKDNAMANTANNFMNVLAEVSGEWVTSQELWPAQSPDINRRGFYLWRTLKYKQVCSLWEVKENNQHEISIMLTQFCQMSGNIFSKMHWSRRSSLQESTIR
jgi:hypothetical protein